jgi:hypothetical protein
MSFSPDLFTKLRSMFLTINDKWVLKNIDQYGSSFLQEELVRTWLCGHDEGEEHHES